MIFNTIQPFYRNICNQKSAWEAKASCHIPQIAALATGIWRIDGFKKRTGVINRQLDKNHMTGAMELRAASKGYSMPKASIFLIGSLPIVFGLNPVSRWMILYKFWCANSSGVQLSITHLSCIGILGLLPTSSEQSITSSRPWATFVIPRCTSEMNLIYFAFTLVHHALNGASSLSD